MSANRGKWAEGRLRDQLKLYSGWTSFVYERLPDAHAGSMKVALADFHGMHRGAHFLLEVKEVQHEYRLPYQNYSADQVARMRTWKMAGSNVNVLVCFQPGRAAKWRSVPLEKFLERNPATPSGSWDLREYETHTLPELLQQIFGCSPPCT